MNDKNYNKLKKFDLNLELKLVKTELHTDNNVSSIILDYLSCNKLNCIYRKVKDSRIPYSITKVYDKVFCENCSIRSMQLGYHHKTELTKLGDIVMFDDLSDSIFKSVKMISPSMSELSLLYTVDNIVLPELDEKYPTRYFEFKIFDRDCMIEPGFIILCRTNLHASSDKERKILTNINDRSLIDEIRVDIIDELYKLTNI